jgi:DNA-binding XRE family transcriptional regulator
MTQQKVDAATERLVREILSGRDGEVRVQFRVSGDSVWMEVLERGPSDETSVANGEHVPFAQWMSDLIHSRRMSQEAMARLLGVSLKTVNRWVNGRTEPRMRELRRIQEAFGVAPPL